MIITMRRDQIELVYIDIPTEYAKLTKRKKNDICNNLINMLLQEIDRELDVTINRIKFLDEVLESSIITNNDMENYEVSQVLYEMRKMLNIDEGN